jgi:hypothetical protein
MSYDFKIYKGDFKIGSDGDIQKVENTEKLIQDILKVAITPLGSNRFFPWYGSPVSKSLIGNVFDMEFVTTVASGQLMNSLESLQTLQQEQARRQRVTPFEQIAAVRRVEIERNQVDPRFFTVAIDVLTKALSEASTEFVVRPTIHGL